MKTYDIVIRPVQYFERNNRPPQLALENASKATTTNVIAFDRYFDVSHDQRSWYNWARRYNLKRYPSCSLVEVDRRIRT